MDTSIRAKICSSTTTMCMCDFDCLSQTLKNERDSLDCLNTMHCITKTQLLTYFSIHNYAQRIASTHDSLFRACALLCRMVKLSLFDLTYSNYYEVRVDGALGTNLSFRWNHRQHARRKRQLQNTVQMVTEHIIKHIRNITFVNNHQKLLAKS